MNFEELMVILNDNSAFMAKIVDWGMLLPKDEWRSIYCKGHSVLRTRRKKYCDSFLLCCRPFNKEWSIFKNTFFSYEKKGKRWIAIPIQKIIKLSLVILKSTIS
ncbi:hypothetical protein A0H76_2417 [Hepatospora eriocheir]|uniref:Uncharacterized protein n=1 Tax=Hepatospora eriocheir TaxID=1081669 RepID=A0A1X0QFA5_9MICR|nr:hypothetical protein A0H76_2417 [Hepatospora eriocheir]